MSQENEKIDPVIDGKEGTGSNPKITMHVTGGDAKAKLAKKKWLTVFGILGLLVIVASGILGGNKTVIQQKKVESRPLPIVPEGDVRASFERRTQAQVSAIQAEIQNMKVDISSLRQLNNSLREMITKNQQDSQLAVQKLQASVENLIGEQKNLKSKSEKKPVNSGNLPPPPESSGNLGAIPPPLPPLPPGAKRETKNVRPTDPNAPIVSTPNSGKESKNSVSTNTTYVQNQYAGYIPSGSFASVVLITGIEAGTASQSQSNPQPVLMRVQTDAILPGSAGYKIKSCMITGSAFGSASTERAYIRIASLSCVDKDDHLVIDAPLKGYVVDSDGMFGLRGKQVQRAGALLAKTMLAGFASGLGQALSGAQGTSYSGSNGSGLMVAGGAALKTAGLNGVSNAANELAKFYLDQAKNIFPVIEVPPKRKATIVLSEGTSLKWNDYSSLYVKTERPTK